MFSICNDNFELKILSEFKKKQSCENTFDAKKLWHSKDGWMDGRMDGKAGNSFEAKS